MKHLLIACALFTILAVQIAVDTVTYITLRNKNRERVSVFQRKQADGILSFVGQRMSDFTYLNQRNAAYMTLHGVPWVPFTDYITMLQLHDFKNNDLIESLNFVPVVKAKLVEAFNTWCTHEFGPSCVVKRIIAGSNTSTLTPYPYVNETITAGGVYYPVIYAYPTSLSSTPVLNALGLNLNSSTFDGGRLLSQMDMARRSNTSITTGRIGLARRLSTNPSGNYGVYLTYPARYRNGTLMGYSNLALRISSLYDGAITSVGVPRKHVSLMIFETSAGPGLSVLYQEPYQKYSSVQEVPLHVLRKSVVTNFDVFERKYTIIFTFSEKYKNTAKNTNVFYIPFALAGGIFILDASVFILLRWYLNRMRTKKMEALHKNTNDLLAYTHHELRNPLNVITGLVDFHCDRLASIIENWNTGTELDLIEEALHDMKIAGSSCKFMEHVVNDVLIIQKLEQRVLDITEESVHIYDLFISIKESLRQKIEEHKALSLKIDCPLDINVHTDPFRLRQILTNFVSNAIKYTSHGTITLYAWTLADSIVLGCLDTGRGIQERHKHLIFKSHVQLNHKDIDRHGSNGLGLYLSKLLADRLNCEIGFDSDVLVGSDFYIKFKNTNE